MNLEEFYLKLDEIRDRYDWFLDNLRIRCKSKKVKSPEDIFIMCPLTAVCKEVKDKFLHRAFFMNAGYSLEIPNETSWNIACGADNSSMNRKENISTRERMLEILRLAGGSLMGENLNFLS
jgi:hypothetical protein